MYVCYDILCLPDYLNDTFASNELEILADAIICHISLTVCVCVCVTVYYVE